MGAPCSMVLIEGCKLSITKLHAASAAGCNALACLLLHELASPYLSHSHKFWIFPADVPMMTVYGIDVWHCCRHAKMYTVMQTSMP